MKSIVVSVDYHDLLEITLSRNIRHFDKTLVVTNTKDYQTYSVAKNLGAEVYQTDAFYKFGASFNKGLAMELGLQKLGKDGWIVVWDADTLFPDSIDIPNKEIGKLYGARRKVAYNESQFNFNALAKAEYYNDINEIPGYFQMFHADDPAIKDKEYWYPVTWRHAGGCDSFFQTKWRGENKVWADFWVIHYGEPGQNWHGRYTDFLDGSKPPDYITRAKKQQSLFEIRKEYGITDYERITKTQATEKKE